MVAALLAGDTERRQDVVEVGSEGMRREGSLRNSAARNAPSRRAASPHRKREICPWRNERAAGYRTMAQGR
jgi:hypothetical protein